MSSTSLAVTGLGSQRSAWDLVGIESVATGRFTVRASRQTGAWLTKSRLLPIWGDSSLLGGETDSEVDKQKSTLFGSVAIYQLPRLIKRILGRKAYRRIKRFQKYKSGWADAESYPLSSQSQVLLYLFLLQKPQFPTNPSVFMTRDGFLELAWEDRSDCRIHAVFGNQFVELLDDAGEESKLLPVVADSDVRRLAAHLKLVN